MRACVLVAALLSLLGCKRKDAPSTDAASLAQIFADTDAGTAAAESASVSAAEPLPSLKHVDVPPPVLVKPSVSASAAASAAGNPNLPQCIVAKAFCDRGKPECESKKQACLAAGGRM